MHLKLIGLFFLLLSQINASITASPALKLAKAHGIDAWSNVQTIEFTFFVNKTPPVNRAWHWNLDEKTATRTIDGESVTIQLDALKTEKDASVHQQFINDTFWLLFPFNVVWSNPKVTDNGSTEVEIDGERVTTNKLTALWPSDEGYTPGDAYDLFIDDNSKILAWTFRKGNTTEGKFFTWKNPVDLEGVRVYEAYYLTDQPEPFIEFRDLQIKVNQPAQ